MGLEIKQKQEQQLSKQQLQLMQLLNLPALLLEARIQEEIQNNPALEDMPNLPEQLPEQPDEEEQTLAEWNDQEAYYDKKEAYFREPKASESLLDNLLENISPHLQNDKERLAAEVVLGNLDENGYLLRPRTAIIDDLLFAGQDMDIATLERVIRLIQQTEPYGLAAQNLQECLLIQLQQRPKTPLNEQAKQVIETHFEALKAQEFTRIQKNLHIKNWSEIAEYLGSLHPKPLLLWQEEIPEAQKIQPDFYLTWDEAHQKIDLQALNERWAGLRLDPSFQTFSQLQEKQAKQFAETQISKAQMFLTALQLRAQMLHKIVYFIAQHQAEFLRTADKSQLRPLILKEIATALTLDISTVSRAIQNKYIATDWGTLPLKDFLVEAANPHQTTTAYQIKEKIQTILQENPDLSDQKITEKLKAEGIAIARRTVNKYRKENV